MKLLIGLMPRQQVPTGIGMMIGGDQEMIFLKANLSPGLYLHIHRQLIYRDGSKDEEDFLFDNYQPVKGGGRHGRD